MLSIRELRKSYGSTHALRGVSLDVAPGEIAGLLGPNGAGKTTLVSIVAGLRRADAGSVSVDGVDALASPDLARRRIGLAPQDTGVYPIVPVRHNLRLFGQIAGLTGKALRARITEVAEALDITDLMDRKAGELSGGQKRRLHTAIALLGRPPLLLLDEATTGTDVATRKQLLDTIRGLAAEGAAILYSTHYLHEAEELDATIAIIEQGELIAQGPVRELIATNGGAGLELSFDGPPPPLPGHGALIDGNVARIVSDDASAATARVLASLGDDLDRLQGIEIIQPSLETVYLTLTGRRYANEETDSSDVPTT